LRRKKTIEVHRYNIMKKLNLGNVAALVNYINNSQLELGDRYAS
jgi:two-component system invasion response regulator UvrY